MSPAAFVARPKRPSLDAAILIVDDSPENLHVLDELLRPQYRMLAAISGEAALRVAGNLPKPDLILLDVMMPGMDGYAVLAQLKENPVTRGIPVVFLTALAAAAEEERGLQLGAADYITKPIQPAVAMAKEIAHWHHEKWDGSGYPDGLCGDAIPVSARLMAIADVFDALISVRVYKPAMPPAAARDIIAAGRGKHFDPDMSDALLAGFDDFVTIAERYGEAG
jgi:response regulator RpfG family c-di-GMP phosphodiesterase